MLIPLFATLALAEPPASAPLPPLKHPVAVIAHRAGKALAPENTLAAIRAAIALGVDYVELDVRATRDGRLVLMHDRTVDRTTNGTGAVHDMEFAAIRQLDAGVKFAPRYAGEMVPTFEEALALCKDRVHIYLDHKAAPTEQILAAIRRHGMERQVVVYNGPEELNLWKRLAPQIPIMPGLPEAFRRPGGVAEFLKTCPAEVLDGNLVNWTPELVAQAHAAGVKVYVDNLGPNDNPEGFRRALAMGVDGIQTDYPDRLLQLLREETGVTTETARRGRAFLALRGVTEFTREPGAAENQITLLAPPLPIEIPANEIVVSWNAEAAAGTEVKVEAALDDGESTPVTKWYTLALWSPDRTRTSVKDQADADANVETDILVLRRPKKRLRLRLTLSGPEAGKLPQLKFLGVSLTDTKAKPAPLEPNRAVWGKELAVPSKTQLGHPGADGWCSPTSTAMTLAFWAKRLNRPELDMAVPDAAAAIYDRAYEGTGNWPFNTAFAGAFPGLRAYVTRLSDIRQLEDWIAAGIPVVVSVSYDLLKGVKRASDPGHLLVCAGFTETGDIVLNDPAHRPERGETARRVYPRTSFLRAWQRSKNTVYLIYPEGAALPADPFGHWYSRP
jgi:glycerophosphoryl diester phosphodiesterase